MKVAVEVGSKGGKTSIPRKALVPVNRDEMDLGEVRTMQCPAPVLLVNFRYIYQPKYQQLTFPDPYFPI